MDAAGTSSARFESFDGRVAVVTGGASGIGFAIARHLIDAGARVVIADVEQGALDSAAEQLGATGIRTDVSDLGSMQALADRMQSDFGGVDIVCNNAGVGPKSKIADATIDDWKWLIDVNLMGVVHGVQLFLPMLLANPKGGHIVNTASIGGFLTGPEVGVYGATKAAVVALSEALCWELMMDQANVGVTILAPGPIRTGIFTGSRNRPANRADRGSFDVDAEADPNFVNADWVDADTAGSVVVDAIRKGTLYATTHPQMAELVKMRMDAVVDGLRQKLGNLQD